LKVGSLLNIPLEAFWLWLGATPKLIGGLRQYREGRGGLRKLVGYRQR
jgi:hypothetical protein